VIIENRPGAASTVGVAAGARAAPDGYTLVMAGSASLAIAPTAYSKLAYDPTRDLGPVAFVAWIPFVLVVNPSLPVASVSNLVKYAKENPGKLNYGPGGAGSPYQLLTQDLKSMTGIEMAHVSSAPALNDVVGGHIQVMFSDPLPSLPQIQAGNVRALGVSTITRWPTAPDFPTIDEAGVPGFDMSGWGMVALPAATPKDIIMRLHAELKDITGSPEIRDQILKLILYRRLFDFVGNAFSSQLIDLRRQCHTHWVDLRRQRRWPRLITDRTCCDDVAIAFARAAGQQWTSKSERHRCGASNEKHGRTSNCRCVCLLRTRCAHNALG
jgi:tripartite-type tricarboxylate transporter receptor subunit TctC